MAYRIIPTIYGDVATHRYSQFFEMSGPSGAEIYFVDLRYNARMDRWVLALRDGQDRAVIEGAPVLQLVDLLKAAAPELRPRGFLICQWTHVADGAEEPSERTLGATCELVYFERLEDLDPTTYERLEAL